MFNSWIIRWGRLIKTDHKTRIKTHLARAEPTSSALTPLVQSRLFKLMLNIFSLLVSVMLLNSMLVISFSMKLVMSFSMIVMANLNNQVIWSEVMRVERSLKNANWKNISKKACCQKCGDLDCTSDPPICEGPDWGWKDPLGSHRSWWGPASEQAIWGSIQCGRSPPCAPGRSDNLGPPPLGPSSP